MRKLALALLASFRLASLCGQATDDLPLIGRCATNALRIREFPSLDERTSYVVGLLSSGDELVVLGRLGDTVTIDGLSSSWYAVAGMGGKAGWSFGGYIDIGSAEINLFPRDYEDFKVEAEDSDALSAEGGLCRLLRVKWAYSETEAIFAKTATGRPQVIRLGYFDSDQAETSWVNGLTAADFFGDACLELCAEIREGGGDFAEDKLYIYGRSAGENRYTDYGAISLAWGAGGGGWGSGSGSNVVEGPSPCIVGKNRCIRLVMEAFDTTPVEDRGDGFRRCMIEKTRIEELYALSGSKIVLLKRTVLSVDRSEEKQIKP